MERTVITVGKKINLEKYSRLIILLGLITILAVLKPQSFLTINNISNVFWSISVVGILVSGSIFAFIVGGIDLSVGSVMGLSSVIVALSIQSSGGENSGVITGIFLALLVSLFIGLVHATIIVVFKVPAFLVTFASLSIVLGVSMVISDNKIVSAIKPELFTNIGLGKIGPFTLPIYIMVVAALISYFVLEKTVYGRHLYAIGGNQKASRISGVNNKKLTVAAYMASSLGAGIAGVVLASMTQQGAAMTGRGYETDLITAVVIGGVSLNGGKGTISGAIIGAVLVGFLDNGMNLMSIPSTNQGLVKGAVIIVAIALDLSKKHFAVKKVAKSA